MKLGAFDIVFKLVFSKLILSKENDVFDEMILKLKKLLIDYHPNIL